MLSPAADNNPGLWRDVFPHPKRDDNKYTRGHALIYGGAVMTGATRLAARAAQRIGAGLVTLAAPQSAIPIYAEALESVIVRPADNVKAWNELLDDPKKTGLLIGPGMGLGKLESEFVLAALDTKKPCVLDADALTNFAAHPGDLLKKLHDQCVLTPHEGEFARLFGKLVVQEQSSSSPLEGEARWGVGDTIPSPVCSGDNPPTNSPLKGGRTPASHDLTDKLLRARTAAKISNCTILLKGAETIIAAPDGYAVVNRNAPPWLATGGSGDVLSGLILGLVAQSMPVFLAGAAGAWIHGAIATNFGPGLIAEDIIAGIPEVLKGLSVA